MCVVIIIFITIIIIISSSSGMIIIIVIIMITQGCASASVCRRLPPLALANVASGRRACERAGGERCGVPGLGIPFFKLIYIICYTLFVSLLLCFPDLGIPGDAIG